MAPFRDGFDFYELFKKHQEAFDSTTTLQEFGEKANLPVMAHYVGGWGEQAFATHKAGKATYNPLYFPEANKFSDLFSEAMFVETNKPKPQNFFWLGDSAGFCKHVGGQRGWSKSCPDVRSHYGAKFFGTYVHPTQKFQDWLDVNRPKGYSYSFDAIKREDGILILLKITQLISTTWIALLDREESIFGLFSEETNEMINKERQAEVEAWGECKW